MQNAKINSFANKVGLLLPDSSKRRIILPCLLGMAIGNFLGVKLGNDLSATTAFSDAHLSNVARAVSFLNEEMILDVKAACDAAKMMYMVRSAMVNGQPASASTSPEFDFIAVALGLAPIMSVEVYDLVKEAGISANTVYSQATSLIMSLKQAGMIEL